MSKRTAFPKPGAVAKTVVIKQRWWDSEPERTVTLIENKFANDQWEVYLPDGTWIGTVGRYGGSIDTKIAGTRLRSAGKQRTLWSDRPTYEDARTDFEQVSRADAIRRLISLHERRGSL